uniref:Uncharacterized protein n=1 Tax=Oryza brachyantha TaxID=4533 RepID=J3NEC8_ORYBR
GGGGGDMPTSRRTCTGNVTVGWKLSRRTASSGDGEGKKKSTHRTQDAGMTSGRRHLPAARSTAIDPCKCKPSICETARRRPPITARRARAVAY